MTYPESQRKERVFDVLSDRGALQPKAVADALGENPNTTRSWLRRLLKDGRIERLADGRYCLPREKRSKKQGYDPEPGSWRVKRSPEVQARLDEIDLEIEVLEGLKAKAEKREAAEADAERARQAFRDRAWEVQRRAEELTDGLADSGPSWGFSLPERREW